MKKVILTATVLMLAAAGASAQTFMKSFIQQNYLNKAKLSATEDVFYHLRNDSIIIYNTNLSINSAIAVPTRPNESILKVEFLSRTLFDNDNDLEYLVSYTSNFNASLITVVNENGQDVYLNDVIYGVGEPFSQVYNDSQGAILHIWLNRNSFFYRLQGQALAIKQLDLDATPNLYPNPTSEVINIAGIPGEDLLIFDIYGNIVFKRQLNDFQTTINVDFLANGTYIVKSSSGSNYKFIKQ